MVGGVALDDGVVGRARRAARELVGMTEVDEPARMAAGLNVVVRVGGRRGYGTCSGDRLAVGGPGRRRTEWAGAGPGSGAGAGAASGTGEWVASALEDAGSCRGLARWVSRRSGGWGVSHEARIGLNI